MCFFLKKTLLQNPLQYNKINGRFYTKLIKSSLYSFIFLKNYFFNIPQKLKQ
jgi:hypothetical protein